MAFAFDHQPPKIWNIQYESKELITRKAILNQLNNNLKAEKNRTNQITIVGLPGMGKTQLAKQYAKTFNKNYSIVWWFNDATDLTLQFLCFAKELQKNFYSHQIKEMAVIDNQEILQQTKNFLRTTREPWLLIFDNVSSLDVIEKFVPEHQQDSAAHIIITSTNINYWPKHIYLKEFSQTESIELMERVSAYHQREHLINLAKALHNYPILVSHVAYVMKNSSIDGEQILATLESNPQTNNIIDIAKNTLQHQINHMENFVPKAYKLLVFSSFLQNEYIPNEVLEYWFTQNKIGTKQEFIKAMDILISSCFLSISNTTNKNIKYKHYTMHSVVQDIMKPKLDAKTAKKIIEQAIIVLTDIVSQKGKQVAAPEFVYILPQIMYVSNQAQRENIAKERLLALKLEILEYYQLAERDYKKCMRFIQQNFQLYQKAIICQSEYCARLKTSLSGILWWQGKHKEGAEQQKIALNFYEKNKTISHEYIRGLLYLASHYNFIGEINIAADTLQKTKIIMQNNNRLYDSKLFMWFNEALFYQNLATNLILQDKTYEAKEEFKKALTLINNVEKQFLKTNKPVSLYVHFFIQEEEINSLLGQSQTPLNKLLFLHEQAVEAFNSPNHRIPAILLLLISSRLNNSGNVNAAKYHVEKCISILDAWFGKSDLHKTQAQAYLLLGDIYLNQKSTRKALNSYLFAEKIYKTCYSSLRCADISILYEKISIASFQLKNDLLLRKYVKKHEHLFGKQHSRTKKLYNTILTL